MKKILLLLLTATLFSCGKEIGRIDFGSVPVTSETFDGMSEIYPLASEETTIKVTGGKALSFWTGLDVEYKGEAGLAFDCEFVSNGEVIAEGSYNPLKVSVKINSVETTVGSRTTKRYKGKMSGTYTPAVSGDLTVRVTLVASENPTLDIKKISFIVKE